MRILESLSQPYTQEPVTDQVRTGIFNNAELQEIKLLSHEERQKRFDQWIAVLYEYDTFTQVISELLQIQDPLERGEHLGLLSIYANGAGIRRYLKIHEITSQSLASYTKEEEEIFLIGIKLWNQRIIVDPKTKQISFPDLPSEYPINREEMFIPEAEREEEIILPAEESKPAPLHEVLLFAGR